jgi:hypothetical protein
MEKYELCFPLAAGSMHICSRCPLLAAGNLEAIHGMGQISKLFKSKRPFLYPCFNEWKG